MDVWRIGRNPETLSGHRQVLLEPTTTISLLPAPCGCGQSGVNNLSAYQTHQVIELPVIRPEVTHWRLHQGQCLSCGKTCKASLPREHATGYGPRLTAFVGEMSGIVSISRSAVQDLCGSVFSIPLLVEAVRCRFKGTTPDLRWITHQEPLLACATP